MAPPGAGAPEVVVVPGWHTRAVGVYRSANKTVFSAKYHVIWCWKYRRPVLVGGVEERLQEIMGEVGGWVIEVEDHMHRLVEVPAVPFSKLVQLLEGRSSRLGRREFPAWRRMPSLWSPAWLVSIVGGAPLGVVGRSVENQKRVA